MNVEVLEASFQIVEQSYEDFPNRFYETLFKDHPETKPLFAHTAMEKQGNHLFESLRFVVRNLRNPEILEEGLKGLGTRHVKYGVLPQHYPMVGHALLTTLAAFAGDAWTPEVKQAWIEAYTAITGLMLAGADYPESVVQINY